MEFKLYHGIALVAIMLLVGGGYYIWQILVMGAAYKAKLLCGNVFIAQRAPEAILRDDFSGPERLFSSTIDYSQKSVTAGFPGIPKQKAILLPPAGCVLLAGNKEHDVRNRILSGPTLQTDVANNSPVFNPYTGTLFDRNKLSRAIENAFQEPDRSRLRRTRALVVLYRGHLVAERYAPGFSAQMPLLGWSMTKSVFNALTGILIRQGKMSLEQSMLVPEWSNQDDPRAQITLDHLLRMSSGLKFNETPGAVIADVNTMLLRRGDTAAYAIAKPLQHPPGSYWYYSSGTTNILSRIIKTITGGKTTNMVNFLQTELFQPLELEQAVIEADASGNLIGSSFMYATAREWARFGQLYLQDGYWNGKQILPHGWVHYSSTPAPTAPDGQYGAHFWTNGGKDSCESSRPMPQLTGDLFYAAGYKGQRLIIMPADDLIIVRLGWSDVFTDADTQTLITEILKSRQ